MSAFSETSLVKEVVIVNGLPTVVSKRLPRRSIHKIVIVVIPGNPGLIEFYDGFVTTLFNSLQGQWPIYAISHAGKALKLTINSNRMNSRHGETLGRFGIKLCI